MNPHRRPVAAKKARASKRRLPAPLLLLPLLLAIAAWWRPPAWLWIGYAVLSVLSFAAYAGDKSAARRQGRRTPERSLHLLALAGGWPGALLAQQLLRHKSAKPAFRRRFWATVAFNLAGLLLLAWTLGATRGAPA